MSETRILIAEDDGKMARHLEMHLSVRGYDVSLVDHGDSILPAVERVRPDLVLLDISLPGMDGLTACGRVCKEYGIPVVMITAKDDPSTKVIALEFGADDYITKPFHLGELVARVRAVLRRATRQGKQSEPIIEVDNLRIDLSRREVSRDGESIHLTKIEFDLLAELLKHADTVLTYDVLLNRLWGPGYTDTGTIHVHVCNLRRKLEQGPTSPRWILPVPGVGYRFRM